MVRTLVILISFSVALLADTSYYTVRLGVYQNQQNLEKMVEKFTPALQQTVIFYPKGSVTVASTLPTTNKDTLTKLLPAYRKIFNDAYILSVKPGELPIQKKKNLQKIFL